MRRPFLYRPGFTLVELLVVISIIAVLLAILVPSMGHVRELAQRMSCASQMKGSAMAMPMYADTYGRLPNLPYNANQNNETTQHPYVAYRDNGQPTLFAVNWGCLYNSTLIDNPKSFYCPADPMWRDIFTHYNTPGPWGKRLPTSGDPRGAGYSTQDFVRVTYAYWPQSKKKVTAARLGQIQRLNFFAVGYPELALKMADLDPTKAMFTDNGGHAVGEIAQQNPDAAKGFNVAFGDGSVSFCRPPTIVVGGQEVVMTLRQENESTTDRNAMSIFMSQLTP